MCDINGERGYHRALKISVTKLRIGNKISKEKLAIQVMIEKFNIKEKKQKEKEI